MGFFDRILGRKTHHQTTQESLRDYVIFDLETTGLSRYYSEIIQISALRIANGQPVERFNTYIKPKRGIPSEATAVNHITEQMVSNAPSFKEALKAFKAFVKDDILVGYNIIGFDLPLLNNQACLNGEARINTKYVDVLPIARSSIQLPNYKLTSLAEYMGFDTSGAHDSLFDCELTYNCYSSLPHKEINEEVKVFEGKPFTYHVQLNEQSNAIIILRAIMNEISKDGKIEESEFFELTNWVSANRSLEGSYPFDAISSQIEEILADGVIETSELTLLEELIEEWLDPVEHSRHDVIRTLVGRHVVVTGDFKYGGLDDITEYLLNKGAVIDKSVIKKTEIVVVGALGSKAWAAGNYGNKIKKALEYKAQGQNIQIVKEKDFMRETARL